MIQSIQIKNFKSIVDLKLELGTFNVLIGENGCGKSNILEAIAFGAASSADKLDYEFLGSRGIRVTNPEFMRSAFADIEKSKSIELNFVTNERKHVFNILNNPNNPKKWININEQTVFKAFKEALKTYLSKLNSRKALIEVNKDNIQISPTSELFATEMIDYKDFDTLKEMFSNEEISNFIVYAPEQSSLRKFEEAAQIYPLGVKGEGIFQYLKELSLDKKSKKMLSEIKQNLTLLDWYEGFDLPDNLWHNEYALKIKDKYLDLNTQFFDQKSTNEGFLFLLFYSTLFMSKITPSFFAIDNLDSSFNPKLCMELTKNLSALAKKHKKQVIITTHNPAVLDGLNLKDDNQRLFVVRRNSEGHTKAQRIPYKEKRSMKLSELWTKGFIGGLPENF